MTMLDSLSQAFLEDHRHLTQGLLQLRDAVATGELGRAVEIARTLDSTVGPHIAFEEEIFYPVLRPILGDETVNQLYREHGAGRQVIQVLLACESNESLDPGERDELLSSLDVMQSHAVSCGTLLSQLDSLCDDDKRRMLEQLKERRGQSLRWSQLPQRIATL